eukprot:5812990-Prymnesium_polylepis.1
MIPGGESAPRERLLAAAGLPGLPASPSSLMWRWHSFERHTQALLLRPCSTRYSSGTKVYCVERLESAWHSFDWSATHGGPRTRSSSDMCAPPASSGSGSNEL